MTTLAFFGGLVLVLAPIVWWLDRRSQRRKGGMVKLLESAEQYSQRALKR